MHRREFLAGLGASGLAAKGHAQQTAVSSAKRGSPRPEMDALWRLYQQPVLGDFSNVAPVKLHSIDIYRSGKHFLVIARSEDGLQGICAANPKYAKSIFALMRERVFPHLRGKTINDLEALLEDVYLKQLNYKWQGLAFWVAVAYAELALLDLLGKSFKAPIAQLFGGAVRTQVPIYYASGNRGNSAQQEVAHLQSLVEQSGAHAVKFRLGARMHFDTASMQRDLALIPLVRQTLGDATTLYADANGSFDVPTGITMGKELEAINADFYEEPCRFDHHAQTQAVAAQLHIPIAGGEQESSAYQLIWLMQQGVIQVVQPDLLFHGGLIRCARIAAVAKHLGIPCTPHISGKALGFLYMLHFASFVDNIGPYQEFKGNSDGVPVAASDSALQAQAGHVAIPKGVGLGVEWDKRFVAAAKPL